MNGVALLEQADRVLSGSTPARARMTCWLARAALEEIVKLRLVAKEFDTGTATMRSLLTCLEVAFSDDPTIAERAQYAWSGLSNACHQHAFELTPTTSEVHQLLATVRGLAPTPAL